MMAGWKARRAPRGNRAFAFGSVKGKLALTNHARQHVDVLVGLAGGAAALAIHLEDEQLRVHLHENAFALDDFRPTHIGPNFQALTYEVV